MHSAWTIVSKEELKIYTVQRIVLCGVIYHFANMIVPYWQLHSMYQLPPYTYVEKWLWDCQEINTGVFSDFSQRGYCYSTTTNVFTVWCANAYMHCLRSTCWCGICSGLLRLAPINNMVIILNWWIIQECLVQASQLVNLLRSLAPLWYKTPCHFDGKFIACRQFIIHFQYSPQTSLVKWLR